MRRLLERLVPRKRFTGQPVALLRAHKTAGEAFSAGLERVFREGEICERTFTWQLEGEAALPVRYLQGHIGLPTADRVLPGAQLVTILRDPVKRLVSSYFYWRSQAERNAGEWDAHTIALRLADMTLIEFLTSDDPVVRRATWNVQARLLAGADYGKVSADRTQLFGFEDTPADELADLAIAGMDRFAAVGTVSHFAESMEHAYGALGLPGRPHVVEKNRTPSKFVDQPITDDIVEAAKRLTEADQLLIEAAERRLSKVRG
ncbi:MAG: hypothetical protein AAGA20_05580 [Planctomycetota bacterium]